MLTLKQIINGANYAVERWDRIGDAFITRDLMRPPIDAIADAPACWGPGHWQWFVEHCSKIVAVFRASAIGKNTAEENTDAGRVLSHEEFLQRYVLARAGIFTGALAPSCSDVAEQAWARIQEHVQKVLPTT